MAAGDRLRIAAQDLRKAAEEKRRYLYQIKQNVDKMRQELAKETKAVPDWERELDLIDTEIKELDRQAIQADQTERRLVNHPLVKLIR